MSIHLLKVKKLHPDAILPTRATNGSAGWDLYAYSVKVEGSELHAQFGTGANCVVVTTGIAVEIPDGHVGLICPRSGLALKTGLTILNSPGIIDSDYRGEVSIILINRGRGGSYVNYNERIAQLLIVPIADTQILEVEELAPTARGDHGFGSSGR